MKQPENIALTPEYGDRQFLRLDEFGKLLGVSATTVSRWGRLGLIKVTRFSPRCNLVNITEIERIKRGEMFETREGVCSTHKNSQGGL